MADVKTFVEVKAKLTRSYYDFTDKDGNQRNGVGVRVDFEMDGESIKLRIDERDSKLVAYMLKKLGVVVVDNEGNVVPDRILENLK